MPSWLAEAVQKAGGKIRFDRFMELALFDPIHGYYSAQMHNGKAGRGAVPDACRVPFAKSAAHQVGDGLA